jgi:lipooligosaccharide transport system ATP-binding protein
MEPIIEARGLTKSFGGITAVDGISFQVGRGESFGLLGPNGAGKTSTVRMVYGFSPIGSGILRVFGLDVTSQWRTIRQSIGVCQQDNSLDPDLTVRENLEVFAGYFDIPRRRAREKTQELLEFVALDHRGKAKVEELSGGMMRRLVLARALINEPRLLILDEPTTGLDPQARHQVWQRLEELKARGLTILLTTHYMDEASRLCDRLLILDHGQILVEGRPQELIRRYVGKEVVEVAFPQERLRRFVRERRWEHEDLGNRLIIYSQDGEDLYRLISRDYCREGCHLRMASLEDVFLKLTGRGLRE